MMYRSKVDSFFVKFMLVVILIIGAVTLLPLFFADELREILLLVSTFIFTIVFILWSTINVKYVFHEDFLYVQGGPFRSRIPYEKIIKISPAKEVLTGYRILTSKDAIEIFYHGGLLGSVKISPYDKDSFIHELIKRCPNLKADNELN